MPKGTKGSMSIAELQKAIAKAEKRVQTLERRRARLLAQLEGVEADIANLTGKAGLVPKSAQSEEKPKRKKKGRKAAKKRRTRAGSLPDTIAKVLKAADDPMNAPQIAEAVLQKGYKTKSKNVTALVRESISRVPGIKKVSRGLYTVK